MFRRMLPAAAALALALGGLATALAQDATPVASPAVGVAGQPLDLAAMLLTPADAEAVGLEGFGVGGFGDYALRTPGEVARSVAGYRGVDVADTQDALEEAGFRRLHSGRVARPGADPEDFGVAVDSAVDEYATAEGAAAGFALLEDERGDPPAFASRDLPEARALGDQSEATRSLSPLLDEAGARTGETVETLNVTARTGNLVANVWIRDGEGGEPDLAAAEALAERLLANVERVRAEGGPGLSYRLARPARAGAVDFDAYERLGGVTLPGFGESEDDLAERDELSRGTTDVYDFQALLGDNPYYVSRLYRFPDAEQASAYLRQQPVPTLGAPDSGYTEVVEDTDAARFGDESRAFAYAFPLDEATTVRGYAVFARSGNTVARVQVDAVPGVDLAAVEELAAAQVACLEADAPCERVPVPDGLVAEEGAATPAP